VLVLLDLVVVEAEELIEVEDELPELPPCDTEI
jgi:hypothetical protein